MSNKNFSRKMMVSKEAVVFYGLILNLEEKILYFFICLLELCYNEYNKSCEKLFF